MDAWHSWVDPMTVPRFTPMEQNSMPPITTYTQLEDFGAFASRAIFHARLSASEIAVWHGLRNVPSTPDLAVRNGRMLASSCWSRCRPPSGASIRSATARPRSTTWANRNNLNCASNEEELRAPIWDQPDANGQHGAMACIVVPWLVDYMQKAAPGQPWPGGFTTTCPYASLYFFAVGAFNIGWHEAPERRIDSYAPPKGCLTRRAWLTMAARMPANTPGSRSWCVLPPGALASAP